MRIYFHDLTVRHAETRTHARARAQVHMHLSDPFGLIGVPSAPFPASLFDGSHKNRVGSGKHVCGLEWHCRRSGCRSPGRQPTDMGDLFLPVQRHAVRTRGRSSVRQFVSIRRCDLPAITLRTGRGDRFRPLPSPSPTLTSHVLIRSAGSSITCLIISARRRPVARWSPRGERASCREC